MTAVPGQADGPGAGDPLAAPVTRLPGIGSARARQLRALGLCTVADLLLSRPRRYEDRRGRHAEPWVAGESRALRALIRSAKLRRWGWRRCVLDAAAEAGDGAPLHLRWFNMPYLAQRIAPGTRLWVFGKLKETGGAWSMDGPEFEIEADDGESAHRDRIVPIYGLSGKIPQRIFRSAIARALEWAPRSLAVADPRLDRGGTWPWAIRALHFPESLSEAEVARKRLALEEFVVWQAALALRRAGARRLRGAPLPHAPAAIARVLANAGFEPTAAQRRAISQIAEDLARTEPMNRLLQGDVGSGKTLVAAAAMAQAVAAGRSCALMAPTALLARQHAETLRRLLAGAPAPIHIVAGEARSRASHRPPAIWIGTHALFQERASLPGLGLIVIDEQHRFGVAQRARLRGKGEAPHVLVMSATPIPRTLALTLYGDLDVSLLDERPPGRRPPATWVRTPAEAEAVWAFAKAKADEGRQVFVVFPTIAGPAGTLKSLESEAAFLRSRFAPHRVAIAHGRMGPDERDAAMAAFASGQTPVLLATTLVEVGIDVPGAAVMIVEHAERFGLAQLHQMRGRVGRGTEPSWCVLLCRSNSDPARRRLGALARHLDGFRIAEIDFQARGAGDLLGIAQSGRAPFRMGNLLTDAPLLLRARDIARDLIARDPDLATPFAAHARALLERLDAAASDPA